MSESKYFEKALSDMKDSFAGADGIKHLADLGYSMRDIQKALDFPFTMEKIGRVIWDHQIENETILLKEPGSNVREPGSRFIKKTDAFGKQSFIRVSEPVWDTPEHTWKKVSLQKNDVSVRQFLNSNSSCGPDYVMLDFGMLKSRREAVWKELLSLFDGDDRDYIEFLPWENSLSVIYHRTDDRIVRVLSHLEGSVYIPGVFYFAVTDV
jgi:hypothetical protein